jgi:hypothetical protein
VNLISKPSALHSENVKFEDVKETLIGKLVRVALIFVWSIVIFSLNVYPSNLSGAEALGDVLGETDAEIEELGDTLGDVEGLGLVEADIEELGETEGLAEALLYTVGYPTKYILSESGSNCILPSITLFASHSTIAHPCVLPQGSANKFSDEPFFLNPTSPEDNNSKYPPIAPVGNAVKSLQPASFPPPTTYCVAFVKKVAPAFIYPFKYKKLTELESYASQISFASTPIVAEAFLHDFPILLSVEPFFLNPQSDILSSGQISKIAPIAVSAPVSDDISTSTQEFCVAGVLFIALVKKTASSVYQPTT